MIVSNLFGLSTLKVSIESKEQTVFRNAKGRTVFFDFFLLFAGSGRRKRDIEEGETYERRQIKFSRLHNNINFQENLK